MITLNTILLFLVINLLSHNLFPGNDTSDLDIIGYKLSAPDTEVILPDVLNEVSGVTIIDQETLAFIQDEKGVVYIYNTSENLIKYQIAFAEKGDYEDLAVVNNTIYVLRSDATIFGISEFKSMNFKVTRYKTGVPSDDNEGLCYDANNNRLLIGCKGDIKKEALKKKRALFSFNLSTMKSDLDPVYIFDSKDIANLIASTGNSSSNNGKKGKKEEPELRTSAIGINPKTGKLFLISASDHIICQINKNGSIEKIENLDKELFPQAEGIAFFPDGDMLITNEGRNKKPTLLRFNYRGEK
jgi:uncharacterized protein YjiK